MSGEMIFGMLFGAIVVLWLQYLLNQRKKNRQLIWFDYDKEADVMYIRFQLISQPAIYIDTDDLVIRKHFKHRKKLVGITIIDFSKRTSFDHYDPRKS